MTDQPTPAVPEPAPVEEKKSRFNFKVIGGVLAGIAATVAGFAIHNKMKDDPDSSETDEASEVWKDSDPSPSTGL